MAAAGRVRSEDQFLCCICLDVFTDPVTTSCGHKTCKDCITEHQDMCPICKEILNQRPELHVNTSMSEMVAQFTEKMQLEPKSSSSEQQAAKPEEVLCDVCTEPKLKALKSCLVCLTSYCETHLKTHLKPHLTASGLITHQLIDPVENLKGKLRKEKKQLLQAELKRVQQYEVDVTLDPDTAYPKLVVSEDMKMVSYGKIWKNLPDKPERFSTNCNVLAKQSFSSGRFYFEVWVGNKTRWDLGVVRESINRKGDIPLSPQKGYWTIALRNVNQYTACAGPPVRLCLECGPQKVGVFVDYEEGLVSFYDVDAAALIYSFTGCCFTDKLLPFFSPCRNDGGENSAPLIIAPVNE